MARLERLSRSLIDFAELLRQARAGGWNVVALDLGVDLSTPQGEFLANAMASAAQWERRIIGQRTKDALAVKRAQGVRLGRPPSIPQALAELGLIDEYEFVVHPRLAGHGPTLFAGLSKMFDLKLVGRMELGSGAVAMRYQPRR